MTTLRLLICDDADNAIKHGKNIEEHWRDAQRKGPWDTRLLSVETCKDIRPQGEHLEIGQKSIVDIGGYDLLLLDIDFGTLEGGRVSDRHGVDLCKLVRSEFPELPIIVFSGKVDTSDFANLIPLQISAYISKRERTVGPWIVEIRRVLAQSSHPLYRRLREVVAVPSAWRGSDVGKAASDVWQFRNPRQRWEAFWNSMNVAPSGKFMNLAFDQLKETFAEGDLMSLGVSPKMRGHLEHVLHVYFTGYVLSHRLKGFDNSIDQGIRRLLGTEYDETKKGVYHELFQFSWLAAATLHDVGYCYELLPDALEKIRGITTQFAFVQFEEKLPSKLTFSMDWNDDSALRFARRTITAVAGKFYPEVGGLFVENHYKFRGKSGSKEVEKINHGVVSGICFLSTMEPCLEALGDERKLVEKFLGWAAVAMCLHSLKMVSKDLEITLSPENDPLSYLLLVCDELQVWDRTRPDENEEDALFENVHLSEFVINEKAVLAKVTYVPFAGAIVSSKHTKFLQKSITKDQQLLSRYFESDSYSVTIEYRIQGHTDSEFANLSF